ncbi:MAG: phosphosulfolactate synthase [Acidimicrobiales bacterium]
MDSICLDLPRRSAKPRPDGLTMVIDNGLPQGVFADAIDSAAPYIDVVKFGWGTAVVTPGIERKFALLADHGIGYYFGGTLFEKFVVQDRFESFLALCQRCRCQMVEISNGTIPLTNTEKAAYIRKCADDFVVVSEVGFKDAFRSEHFGTDQWIEAISEDLEAGATRVITESRESGRSGIGGVDGKPRTELIDAIVSCGVEQARLVFEAPTKDLQTYLLSVIGADANLANIAPADVIGLETLRLGLRADTLLHFEGATEVDARA